MEDNLSRAIVALEMGRFDLAASLAQDYLAECPESSEAMAVISRCCLARDDHEKALHWSARSLELDSDSAAAHLCRGMAFLLEFQARSKQIDGRRELVGALKAAVAAGNALRESVYHAREAVRLNPEEADCHAFLAEALFENDERQKAIEAAMEGLRIEPEHKPSMHFVAKHAVACGRTELAKSVAAMLISREPDCPTGYILLGQALLHCGSHEEAEKQFVEALRVSPDERTLRLARIARLARFPVYRWMIHRPMLMWQRWPHGRRNLTYCLLVFIGVAGLTAVMFACDIPEIRPYAGYILAGLVFLPFVPVGLLIGIVLLARLRTRAFDVGNPPHDTASDTHASAELP